MFLVSVYFTNKESQDIFENNYSFFLNGETPVSVQKVEKDNENFKSLMLKNSWGKLWGQKGHVYISFKDMERLIKEQGEICLAKEIKS